MPYIACSVRGLPGRTTRTFEASPSPVHDGARPSTAEVCRHLLGDAFRVPDDALEVLREAAS